MSRVNAVVYVASALDLCIDVFNFAPDAKLSWIQRVRIGDTDHAPISSPIAVSPDKCFLYAAIRTLPYRLMTFSIDHRTGMLKKIGTSDLPDSMAYLTCDPTGYHLIGASVSGNSISVMLLSPLGQARTLQVLDDVRGAHAIIIDPTSSFALGTSLHGDVIHSYKWDETHLLRPNGTTPVTENSGPRHAVFHPDGYFVYVLHEFGGFITTFIHDPGTGRLGLHQRISMPHGESDETHSAADIHLTPDGKFLYASERTSNTLAAYSVEGDGRLSEIGSFPTEHNPRGFGIDPRGRYLIAAGQTSNRIALYEIEQLGCLARLASYSVGKGPNWIEIVDLGLKQW